MTTTAPACRPEPVEGYLPRGWTVTTVGKMAATIQYGHTASAVKNQNGPRFLRITDIQNGKVEWDNVPSCQISRDEVSKYKLQDSDLVFARTGATTGKSFLIQNCPEAIFASYLIRLRLNDSVLPAYVSLFFQSGDYWKQIETGKRGIGQPNVNAQTLSKIQLPLPPLPEQHRIVGEIEKQFTRLEAGVTALRRVQANLKRYRASILKAACEGKLVPTKGKWTLVTVGKLAPLIQYGYTASAKATPGGPRFLRITDIQDRKVDWDVVPFCKISAEDSQKFRLQPGDMVFARTGATTGKSYLIRQCPEAVFASYLIRLRLGEAVLPEFIHVFFQSPNYWRQIEDGKRGIGQPNVNAQTLSRVNVPLPPLAEQTRIVAEVERRLSVVEELEAVVSANLARAQRLRQAILKKAFTGELV